MADESEMSAPVTRGEMNRALKVWAGAVIGKVATKIDDLAFEMRSLVNAAETKILDDVKAMLDPVRDAPKRLNELERHDLPLLRDRVRDLEAKVFAPKRRATAARRKRS